MPKYQFLRDTEEREGAVFKAGEIVELSGASLGHWLRRQAVAEIKGDGTTLEVHEDPSAAKTVDEAHAQDSNPPGDGSEPQSEASGTGATSASAKKGGGRGRK